MGARPPPLRPAPGGPAAAPARAGGLGAGGGGGRWRRVPLRPPRRPLPCPSAAAPRPGPRAATWVPRQGGDARPAGGGASPGAGGRSAPRSGARTAGRCPSPTRRGRGRPVPRLEVAERGARRKVGERPGVRSRRAPHALVRRAATSSASSGWSWYWEAVERCPTSLIWERKKPFRCSSWFVV